MVEKKIVFFDGECGLCNRSVQFILNNEKFPELNFAPLQSDFTKLFFEQENESYPISMESIYFHDGSKFYTQSTAVLKISKFLKFPYSLLNILRLIPPFLRDPVYNFIAKRRNKWVNQSCVVPTQEQKKRFLA